MKFSNYTTIKIKSKYQVSELSEKIRFNSYAENFVDVITSRKGVKKAILKGELRLNGEKVHGGTWLKEGDEITWVDLENAAPKPYLIDLEVIFEDEDLAVIYKPAGINVSGNQFRTLQNALPHNLRPSTKLDVLDRPLPVHRLDNQTSGLLVVAKTKLARINLGKAFEDKSISKVYHAVVIGKVEGSGKIEFPIENKECKTLYRTIDVVPSLKNKYLSLLELEPKTGRTHQLRIHCSTLKHPILGDKVYGDEGMVLKSKGLFLCATRLQFNHPTSNELLKFSIPTPHKFLKRLENENRRFKAKETP